MVILIGSEPSQFIIHYKIELFYKAESRVILIFHHLYGGAAFNCGVQNAMTSLHLNKKQVTKIIKAQMLKDKNHLYGFVLQALFCIILRQNILLSVLLFLNYAVKYPILSESHSEQFFIC